ncbi:glycosyl transferase [Thiohalocapsa marina]|uniref:glycosyl transferase n=1 Tax=Thiohalocapsa marina TaxID=424902 RepID=UPI0036DBCD49
MSPSPAPIVSGVANGQLPGILPGILMAAAGVGALAVSAWLTRRLSRGEIPALRILDHPNARSLHHRPVPRSGGVGLLAGLLAGILAGVLAALLIALVTGLPLGQLAVRAVGPLFAPLAWILPAVLLVAAVSLRDDLGDVPQHWRLAAHLGAAALLLLGGLHWGRLDLPGLAVPFPAWLAWTLTAFYVVWMINLYNFMDGMDGLAGSMAAIGFGALAWLGWRAGAFGYAGTALVVALAAVGFLTRNLPPARIFLGDVGSSVLGLLAAALTLWGAQLGLFPLWAGWLIFSPFIVDASWTLLRRLWRREPFWRAHRSHHYQRLVLAGWSHGRTLGRAVLLMLAAAASAVAAVGMTPAEQWTLLFAWAGVYGLVHVRVGLAERAADQRQAAP